eukprot:scaffold1869_cov163-Ochromonas_danica.AAC.1
MSMNRRSTESYEAVRASSTHLTGYKNTSKPCSKSPPKCAISFHLYACSLQREVLLFRYREKIFLQPLGRTNTECFTSFPIYGSNLNEPHAHYY